MAETHGQRSRLVPAHVRTEPVQERSAARVERLLVAAAEVVDEVGIERLTTAMVADRAQASIGTVYRYFPDRIALLQALRERIVVRFRSRVERAIRHARPDHWWQAADVIVDCYVDLFRSEPGAAVVRFDESARGITLDEGDFTPGHFSDWFTTALADQFDVTITPSVHRDVEIAVEVGDALVRRAFRADRKGDPEFIAEARSLVREFLTARYASQT